ncbi:MAG: TIM barrel protein [Verrucomicrobiales bacterium]|jgi:hydroxypyruvate isomerase|nr:TIM barrel protein [Verrucomicrobiales bacterium]
MNNLKQSFAWWCVVNRGLAPEAILKTAADIGYDGVELIGEELWPLAQQHGLRIVSVNGHRSIEDGLNRRENAARIEQELRVNIAKAARWDIPVLICFSGNRAGLGDADGLDRCAETLARIAPVAADAGVTLAVELLNSKVDHRDYQADHTAWGVELCRRVNLPACRLLYDIYHMQIMEGDVIRAIQDNHSYFAHYHTAGNPGRGQPDETQELNYPAIYRAIAATGYTGYIGHEFFPKLDIPTALAKAFTACRAA